MERRTKGFDKKAIGTSGGGGEKKSSFILISYEARVFDMVFCEAYALFRVLSFFLSLFLSFALTLTLTFFP